MSPFFLIAALSCQNAALEPADGGEDASGSLNMVTVNFTFRNYGANSETKSCISADESEIKDINIFAYRDGRLEGGVYLQDETTAEMTLLSGSSYRFYALANTGEIDAPVDEQYLLAYRYTLSDIMMVELDGFPMSGYTDATIDRNNMTVTISLERLVAKVNLKVDADELPGFSVRSVRMMNTPRDVAPFAGRSAAGKTIPGDYATASDIDAINTGGSAYFYMLENCQGELLPDNEDPWKKTPETIPDGKAELCTYMEVEAELDGSSGLQGPVTYRFYLGQDVTSDFNIFRNTENTITLVATEEGLGKVSWKIDTEKLTETTVPVIIVGSDGLVAYTDSKGDLNKLQIGSNDWYSITYGKGRYVAAGGKFGAGTTYGSSDIAYSSDGISWATKNLNSLTNEGTIRRVFFDGKKFLAIARIRNSYQEILLYSTDGQNWLPGDTVPNVFAIAFNDKTYLGVYNAYLSMTEGRTAVSYDGIKWTSKSIPGSGSKTFNDIAYGNGRFVFARNSDDKTYGSLGYCNESLDEMFYQPCQGKIFSLVIYTGSRFYAFGDATCAISTDGVDWEFHDTNINTGFRNIKYQNGQFVGITGKQEDTIIYSSDGITWRQLDTDVTNDLYDILIMQ